MTLLEILDGLIEFYSTVDGGYEEQTKVATELKRVVLAGEKLSNTQLQLLAFAAEIQIDDGQ